MIDTHKDNRERDECSVAYPNINISRTGTLKLDTVSSILGD